MCFLLIVLWPINKEVIRAYSTETVAMWNFRLFSVLDLVTQVRDVVFVKCIFSSGKPQVVGISEWGVYGVEWGNGEISWRATWDWGGQILSQQGGFQVSKGERRGAKGIKKGETESKGIAHKLHYLFYIHVHSENL
jgi:hypothetical protein